MVEIRLDVDGLLAVKRIMSQTSHEFVQLASIVGTVREQFVVAAMGKTGKAPGALELALNLNQLRTGQLRQLGERYASVAKAISEQLVEIGQISRPDGSSPLTLLERGGHALLGSLGGVASLLGGALINTQTMQALTGPVRAGGVPAPSVELLPGQPTIADLYRRVGTLHPGQIEIDPIVGPDNKTRYVVLIHGMGMLSTSPNNVFDSVLSSVDNKSAASRSVIAALRKAHLPKGSELMLVGHSHGGITAMNLATDPAFNGPDGLYHVTHVVTAGSPVGNKPLDWIDPRHPTQVLELEHRSDIVPELDGEQDSNHDPHRTVYQFGASDASPGVAHSLKTGYLPELDRHRFSSDAGVHTFTESASEYLHGQPGQAERFETHYGEDSTGQEGRQNR